MLLLRFSTERSVDSLPALMCSRISALLIFMGCSPACFYVGLNLAASDGETRPAIWSWVMLAIPEDPAGWPLILKSTVRVPELPDPEPAPPDRTAAA